VRILLDTHVFLWIIADDLRLTPRYESYFKDPDNDLFLSIASCWEIVIKTGLNRLHLPSPATEYLMKQLDINQVALLGIRPAHLKELETLPPLHGDPFDRMIVAQARSESMGLMSKDKAMRGYKARIL
jgi:PIN domain nuclease of toxin-antitoxin system